MSGESPIDPNADLVFEVRPDPHVFDGVRQAVVDQFARQYGNVLAVEDVPGSVRVDVVDLEPAEWHVEARVESARDAIRIEADVPADEEAAADVIEYLRQRLEDRFGDTIDADAVAFVTVDLRPAAWFIDAKIEERGR